ncbi:MAG: N-acetylneuraminate lyase [Planctomycetia bacterium]|nr:N-acetylneuraminate lyase [Planctomycetia bacterium]
MHPRLAGIIPATYTPLGPDGRVDFAAIPPFVGRLLADGVTGLYVCGSTGEGVSLSSSERRGVAAAFVQATGGRVPVIVHVGHDSLAEAADLAGHAAEIGASATSAMPPCYFPIRDAAMAVECSAAIAAAAPKLPFYYYHIPAMTGVAIDVVELLKQAGERIPNFAGVKYTAHTLHEFAECVSLDGGRFEMLSGYDEMLLPALAVGARAAVGSTFNAAAPLYRRIMAAFDAGNLEAARTEQLRAVAMIRVLMRFPFHPAMKAVLAMIGPSCGACRPPLPRLTPAEQTRLRESLDAIGFFTWARP